MAARIRHLRATVVSVTATTTLPPPQQSLRHSTATATITPPLHRYRNNHSTATAAITPPAITNRCHTSSCLVLFSSVKYLLRLQQNYLTSVTFFLVNIFRTITVDDCLFSYLFIYLLPWKKIFKYIPKKIFAFTYFYPTYVKKLLAVKLLRGIDIPFSF